MYIDYSTWDSYEYSISALSLDLNNPRIKYKGVKLNQTQIIKYLIEKEKAYELAKQISEDGYFVGEEPIICLEDDKKIVLEGNRRTAALKILQDPKKYLSTGKANVLLKNISANKIDVNRKIRCHIAPNRLLANPIIYNRHRGEALKTWNTGNQYAFVAEMYYTDGLTINEISEVLNEPKSKVLSPIKAYNLFTEAQSILSNSEIDINVAEFNFTNLERFYTYEDGRKFLGIEFDENTGELIIKIPRVEFEKRIIFIFKELIDAERFSRDFNNEKQKIAYLQSLRQNPDFDFDVKEVEIKQETKSSTDKLSLEERKKQTNIRKKGGNKNGFGSYIVAPEINIFFNNDKLDSLFAELRSLSPNKKYSFAILLRTYLEQSLYFYILQKKLSETVTLKLNESRRVDNLAKVDTLINFIKGKHKTIGDIEPEKVMNILKFDKDKEFSSGLKVLLDYIINNELEKLIAGDAQLLRNTKQYLKNVKDELDLSVHNFYTVVDISHNIRAWNSLYPLLNALSLEITDQENE